MTAKANRPGDAFLRDALGPEMWKVYLAFRAKPHRDNGSHGGRPKAERPDDESILLLFGEHFLKRGNSYQARTWLTRDLAVKYTVNEKTARGWITQAIGPRRRKKREITK
jgi:hypothetical protein